MYKAILHCRKQWHGNPSSDKNTSTPAFNVHYWTQSLLFYSIETMSQFMFYLKQNLLAVSWNDNLKHKFMFDKNRTSSEDALSGRRTCELDFGGIWGGSRSGSAPPEAEFWAGDAVTFPPTAPPPEEFRPRSFSRSVRCFFWFKTKIYSLMNGQTLTNKIK